MNIPRTTPDIEAGPVAGGAIHPPPAAAVIIPHYNDARRLERCLAALLPQVAALAAGPAPAGAARGLAPGPVPGAAPDASAPPGPGAGPHVVPPPAVEVLVVDNGSTGEEAARLAALGPRFPAVRFLAEPRKGAAHARNRGVAESSAPALFFIDSDCVPAPDWLATAFRVAPRADLVGGRVALFDETPPPRTGAQAFEAVFAFDNRSYVERKGFSVTANLLTRRDVFAATGPFVHGLSEDLDWCRRAGARGYRIAYAPELAVGHPSRGDWAALRRKWRRITAESFELQGRGAAARAKWAARALAMAASGLAHAPRLLLSPELHGAGERLSGLGTLLRLRAGRAGMMLRQAISGRVQDGG